MTAFLVSEHFLTPRHLQGSGLIPLPCLYPSQHSSGATLILFHVEFVLCLQTCARVGVRIEIKIAAFPRRALWLSKMDQTLEQRER